MTIAKFLPYGRQTIEDDDIGAVVDALRGDFLTTGPKVDEFEDAFARATGAEHAIACNSGTAALHLAVLAEDIGPGDVAIVPTMTFLATANVVRMTGAEVVFADVDGYTGLLTPDTFSEACRRASAVGVKPKLALPVHLNGQICDMKELARVAAANNIAMVTDACHALGSKNVGATDHSLSNCFSTHPVKAIATGEGGVVTTRDAERAARMRRLRSHGMNRETAHFENHDLASEAGLANPWYYEMQEFGWNYRMPDILCALGISQLKKLERFWRRRREIAALYDRLLAPLSPVVGQVPRGGAADGWHLYVVLIDFAALATTRAQFMDSLKRKSVGSQVHYVPVHRQPYYRHRYGALSLPGADAYYARCLSLPFYPAMSDDDVHHVVDALTSLAVGLTGLRGLV